MANLGWENPGKQMEDKEQKPARIIIRNSHGKRSGKGSRRTRIAQIAGVALLSLLVVSQGLWQTKALASTPQQVAPNPQDVTPVLYSSAPDRPDPQLQKIVDDEVADLPGTWGVVVKKLDTGQYAEYGADTQQVTASLYKLWVFGELYRQAESGEVNLDDLHDESLSMIQWSSNDAAAYLVNVLGPDNINDFIQQLGLKDSVLDWSGIGDNLTTPRDIARWLELLATSRMVNVESSREMIGIMLGQQINNRLPQGLPAGVPFAHKTGDLDALMHDAGIVYAASGPYIIVCMASHLPSYYGVTEEQAELSSRVYNYFAGSSGEPSRYFPETKQSVGNGFLKYWYTQGQLPILGFPLTPEMKEGNLTVQYFERARLEWHPELAGTQVPGVTLFPELEPGVTLGLIGIERANQLGLTWADSDPTGEGMYFPQTGQEITGQFLQYWQENGGERAFGYPISPAKQMVSPSDGKTYLTQWFQRARFELHPELPGAPVVLGRLGAELLQTALPPRSGRR